MWYRSHGYWRPTRWQETLYWAFLALGVLRETRALVPADVGPTGETDERMPSWSTAKPTTYGDSLPVVGERRKTRPST